MKRRIFRSLFPGEARQSEILIRYQSSRPFGPNATAAEVDRAFDEDVSSLRSHVSDHLHDQSYMVLTKCVPGSATQRSP
jgi:hypothetical protein